MLTRVDVERAAAFELGRLLESSFPAVVGAARDGPLRV